MCVIYYFYSLDQANNIGRTGFMADTKAEKMLPPHVSYQLALKNTYTTTRNYKKIHALLRFSRDPLDATWIVWRIWKYQLTRLLTKIHNRWLQKTPLRHSLLTSGHSRKRILVHPTTSLYRTLILPIRCRETLLPSCTIHTSLFDEISRDTYIRYYKYLSKYTTLHNVWILADSL